MTFPQTAGNSGSFSTIIFDFSITRRYKMYTTEKYEASISVSEYVENYVDIPTFLKACRACPNYDQVWSCPSYSFDVSDYWKQYNTLRLTATKIIFKPELLERTYTSEEQNAIIQKVIPLEKERLSEEMYRQEAQFPGSISLSAGSCSLCKNGCAKPLGKPCRFPDKMRYSIESLGGNVGLTIEKLMGLHLEWMEADRLPAYFILVNGLLIP